MAKIHRNPSKDFAHAKRMAQSRSIGLNLILVVACFTTTMLYFTAEKSNLPLTKRTLEGDTDIPRRSAGVYSSTTSSKDKDKDKDKERFFLLDHDKWNATRVVSVNDTRHHLYPHRYDSHHHHHHKHHHNGSHSTDNEAQVVVATDNNDDTNQQQQQQQQQSPYAYLFLIGGIDPDSNSYRGFLYNVMISADILRRLGSKADVWLYVQLSPSTNHTQLPDDELASLQALGIYLHYMERPATASFTDINMEKFRGLNMTQYRRVLYLDADILPLVNMDYLMELSDGDHPLLQPNFVVATLGEPANGGCFMMQPQHGYYQELLDIVERQRESAKTLPYPYFDRDVGWGHSFQEHGDVWKGTKKEGEKWRWHGAHVDQGLLFYYVKYHRQAVTIFRGHVVENWVAGPNGQPVLQASMDPSWIDQYAPKERVAYQFQCDKDKSADKNDYLCKVPYYNFAHFTGSKKPWQLGFDPKIMSQTSTGSRVGPTKVFFQSLFDLSERLGWGITPDNVDAKFKADSPFGYMPNLWDFAQRQQGNRTTSTTTAAATVTKTKNGRKAASME